MRGQALVLAPRLVISRRFWRHLNTPREISPLWGWITRLSVQVSDTLNPHERPFTGMLDRHPRPASGCGGCSVPRFCLGGPLLAGLVRTVFGNSDRWRAWVAGAQGLVVRVVGQHSACRTQLVNQVRGAVRAGQPGQAPAARVRFAAAGEEDGQGGQVRQDLVLADVGVLGPGGIRDGGAGLAVPAPVGGLPVGPR
jgi:hypothetical protein